MTSGWVAPFGNPRLSLLDSSPRLFAAYHVLHRLLAPRHPPCALSNLTYIKALAKSKYLLLYTTIQLLTCSKSALRFLLGLPPPSSPPAFRSASPLAVDWLLAHNFVVMLRSHGSETQSLVIRPTFSAIRYCTCTC